MIIVSYSLLICVANSEGCCGFGWLDRGHGKRWIESPHSKRGKPAGGSITRCPEDSPPAFLHVVQRFRLRIDGHGALAACQTHIWARTSRQIQSGKTNRYVPQAVMPGRSLPGSRSLGIVIRVAPIICSFFSAPRISEAILSNNDFLPCNLAVFFRNHLAAHVLHFPINVQHQCRRQPPNVSCNGFLHRFPATVSCNGFLHPCSAVWLRGG